MIPTRATHRPLNILFFGSGAFGLPVLQALASDTERYRLKLIISQPDRPAGRHRVLSPTPISTFARAHHLTLITPERVNDPIVIQEIRGLRADVHLVIAFGQKLSAPLISDALAINLHGSVLPEYRGAAPIQRAMMRGDTHTGLSVIALADRMDAGDIYAQATIPIDPNETAGELHDRLARMGPALIGTVLEQLRTGALKPTVQDESQATRAPKLTREEGTIPDFNLPAALIRARIHGLNPWPGCTVNLLDPSGAFPPRRLKILRVRDYGPVPGHPSENASPEILISVNHSLQLMCGSGTRLELITVQPPDKPAMDFTAWCAGHPIIPGTEVHPHPDPHSGAQEG